MANQRVYFSIIKKLSEVQDQTTDLEPPLFPWEKSVSEYPEDGTDRPLLGNDKPAPSPAVEFPADE